MNDQRRYIHGELAAGRWFTFSLTNQVGNVGSEYERAIRAKANGDSKHFDFARGCLFELLDLTIVDTRWSKRRNDRLRKLRQTISDELEKGVQPARDLHRYFLLAGLWANIQRPQERNRQSAIGNRK